MAKEIFRYLRGEINGFYLNCFYNSLNKLTKEDKDFLRNLNNTVFKASSDVTGLEHPMDSKDVKGIGLFAGVFMPRVTLDSFNGALRMSLSHEVDGVEYSERGLWKMSDETFEFVHTSDPQEDDINTLATSELKSSMVGEDDVIVGYLSSSVQNLDEEGKIIPERILDNPPEDEAYSEYYGDKFLYFSEGDNVTVTISERIYFELIKALQWIRYNGASIKSMCKVFELLCPEFVKINSIVWNDNFYAVLNYSIDEEYDIELKQVRIEILKYFMKKKFPQVVLVEE